jgi:hypothetical protein
MRKRKPKMLAGGQKNKGQKKCQQFRVRFSPVLMEEEA